MAKPMLRVCWKDHTSELASVYKRLLANNFLVDCTLSAEGRNLKAHRLVLSACSPYFHKLFHEETGKHAFVILLNASFETLKAVIDFVYRGETQIPHGNLKAFLMLAKSLQIKGLKAFSQDEKNKNLSRNTAGKAQGPSEDSRKTCEVQGINASQEGCPENSSQQFLDHSDHYIDIVHTNSSDPVVANIASCEEVQSSSLIKPPQEHQIPVECSEETEVAKVTVKQEPLLSVLLEARNERLDKVKSNKTKSASFESKMDGSTSFIFGEQDLNQFSSETAEDLQQEHVQLNDEMSSGTDIGTQLQPLLQEILVLKSEQMDDTEYEEVVDDHDVPGNDTNEMDEGTEPALDEQNLFQCSSADGLPLEEELATQRRSLAGQQSESSSPHTELQSHEGLQAHPGEQTVAGDGDGKPVIQYYNLSTDRRRSEKKGPYRCEVCGKEFPFSCRLARHERMHTGERPYCCDECGKTFMHKWSCEAHKLSYHAGVRPYRCDVCYQTFLQKVSLAHHMRWHTGGRLVADRPAPTAEQAVVGEEGGVDSAALPTTSTAKPNNGRPTCKMCRKVFATSAKLDSHVCSHSQKRSFPCDVCDKTFTLKGKLDEHKRSHLEDAQYRCKVCEQVFSSNVDLASHKSTHPRPRALVRPHICDTCGKGFTSAVGLTRHKTLHSGEFQHHCEVCGKGFNRHSTLTTHRRMHTGEKPYRCEYCGQRFIYLSLLASHRRKHTGERPYRCSECDMTFTQAQHLTDHARRHTGERPYLCHICGKDFALRDSLRQHSHRHTGERPYSCSVCSMTFTHRGKLSAHKRKNGH